MTEIADRFPDALADRYRVERELGRGGMATVYLAEDLRHGRRVAVKVLPRELAAILGPERFLREIAVTAGLDHPHIVPLLDSGRVAVRDDPAAGRLAEVLYYVMPFVEGESLRARLARERQLPLEDALLIARETADALAYAHSRGVIHRDIKPENILLASGHARVADFGIARAIGAAGGDALTATGMSIGTPSYMSPEQAGGEKQLDGRSDVYALACVLFEMLVGEPPLAGRTAAATFARRLAEPVPSVRTTRPAVPVEVDTAIGEALSPVVADRPSSAAAFSAALGAGAIVRTPPHVEPPTGYARPARRIGLRVAAALLAVGALGVAWVAFRDRSPLVPAASVIAVVPFAPVSPDPDLARLGFELAGTISANLDGVADLRSVDRLSISAQIRDGGRPLDLPATVALGRGLGASSVVYGTLTRAGPSIRLDLRLHATASAAPIADPIMLVAPADSMVAITDSVTRMLLRQVWRNDRPPTPNLGAALGTRSLPALRAFLRGERAVGLNRWTEAADAFRASFGEDSTFWLASWRYDNALRWVDQSHPPDSQARRAYLPHLASLPPSDRELAEANLVLKDSLSAGLDRLRRVTERYPTNWIAWMELGDHLLHMGGLLGNSQAESRRALERATELNPRFVPAWQHLVWLYAWARDSAAAFEAHTRLRQLGAGPGLSALWPGSDYLLQQRLLLRLVAGGESAPAALLDSVAGDYARASVVIVMAPIAFGYGSTQLDLLARARRMRPDAAQPSWEYLASAAWSQRGAWDSAATAMERWVSAGPGPSAASQGALYAFALRAIGAWLGALDPAWVEGQRGAADAGAELLDPAGQALLAWSSGVLALAAGDAPALERARSALGRVEPSDAALAASLAAFGAALRGEPRQAADSLASLERRRVEGRDRQSGTSAGIVLGVNRLAAVRWFLAAGDTSAAMRLLRWTETVLVGRVEAARFQAYALFHLGGILEARGDPAGARHAYEGFLQRYDLPPPAHRWMVDTARAGLSRMEGRLDR